MASLLFASTGFAGRVVELNLGANRFGRGPRNDVQIEHPTVSDQHCEVILRDKALLVRDNGSAEGTFVDGERVTETRLRDGQVLRLGQVELRVEQTGVSIAIPKAALQRRAESAASLPDSLFCWRHRATCATHRCSRCDKPLCTACTRRTRRREGLFVTTCSHCKRPCELVCSQNCGKCATHQCTRCRKVFCTNCVRQLRRHGGKMLKLCPRCSQECLLICPRHPELQAIYRCNHCGIAVCEICAKFSRRENRPPTRVCPFCRHTCVLVCAGHPEARATYYCRHCHKTLCPNCIQQLRGRGGQVTKFCVWCSLPCVPVRERMPGSKSLLNRLQVKVRKALGRTRKRSKASRWT
jgi:hypothetical protein